jgi:hypothetical protein
MGTALIAAAAAIGGAFIGYWLRVLEFRRDHRLRTYAAFVAAFLDAAHVGAGMLAAYTVHGDSMLRPGFDPEIDLGRKRLGEALQTFEAATAEVRMRTASATHTMPAEPVSVGSSAKTFTEDLRCPTFFTRQVPFVEDKFELREPESSLNEGPPVADGLSSAHHCLRIPV